MLHIKFNSVDRNNNNGVLDNNRSCCCRVFCVVYAVCTCIFRFVLFEVKKTVQENIIKKLEEKKQRRDCVSDYSILLVVCSLFGFLLQKQDQLNLLKPIIDVDANIK